MLKIIGRLIGAVLLIGLGFYLRGFLSGGGPPMGMMGMGMPPPTVMAVQLEAQPLDVLDEYIAMVEPVQDVMVRSEVTGYIDDVHFTEGAFVQEGDLLFTINQRQYEAVVKAREAELERATAELRRAETYLQRLIKAGGKSVSASDLETAESTQLQAKAALMQAEANLELARIDLGYSTIRAPISGRIGSAMMKKGNYVSIASELLAHIVQVDPIRVAFSMTDRAYLDQLAAGPDSATTEQVARVRLPNGKLLSRLGRKDFADNQMNTDTGTMTMRYLFDNADGLLVPGGYVNILLGPEQRPMGLRIPQQALLQDRQGSYVLTLDGDGRVGTARVELGQSIETDRVVLDGLKPGDRVVVEGVQKVQPGMTNVVVVMESAQ